MTEHSIDATLDLARRHHQAGRVAEAQTLYRQILARQPNHADALHLLGMVEHQKGRSAAALELIQRAIQIEPNRADFHSNAGLVLAALVRNPEAIQSYRKALAIQPDYPQALNNLGNSLRRVGKFDEAIAALRRAIELRPNYFEAFNNLGSALAAAGDSAGAIAAFGRARALCPDSLGALRNFATACREAGEYSQAADALRRSLPLDPKPIDALNNLGTLLKDLGRLDEALDCFQQAIKLGPENVTAHCNYLFTMWLHPEFDGKKILDKHLEWNLQRARPLASKRLPHENDRREDRRLKIGYVSPDFLLHPVGRFLSPLLENHDHQNFEIFAYFCIATPDSLTPRLRAATDVWRDVAGSSDDQLAQIIRDDRIDILVDLSLHTAENRLLVFARKPAPVQATYLAYPGTSGLDTMDWRLTDRFIDPPGGDESGYSEKSYRLQSYWCYYPCMDFIVDPEPRSRQTGVTTFGCLNNFSKISSVTLQTWIQLLQAVPKSRLVIHAAPGDHRRIAAEKFSAAGVDPARLIFVPLVSIPDYFKQYQQLDIALDPFPYGGGTTTCDALWTGVPVITLRGRTAVGRGGVSILSNVGLTELIAENPADYVRLAAELAADIPRLTQLRGQLRERTRLSPLMDAPAFARDVESAYRHMWRQWCGTK